MSVNLFWKKVQINKQWAQNIQWRIVSRTKGIFNITLEKWGKGVLWNQEGEIVLILCWDYAPS